MTYRPPCRPRRRWTLHGTAAATCVLATLTLSRQAQAADADEDEFERKTVRIGCFVTGIDGKVKLSATGSGFLVGDNRHVVTNFHVALSQPCQVGVAKVMVGNSPIVLKVLANSETNDLAVLEAESPIPKKDPVPALVLAADVASRDEVFVLGFPGIVDSMAVGDNMLRPTTTRGIIGRKIETADRTGMLQIDARTIGGNSGGPWLDACGRLVGIHSRGSYIDQLPVGYSYAIQTDHLLPLLDAAKVTYRVTGSCTFAARYSTGLAWSAALLVGGGALLRYSPPGRRLWAGFGDRAAGGGSASASTVPRGPHLVGLSGALRGVTVDLAKGAIVLGRDARVSNLVLPASCDDVSKRHCLVRTDPAGSGFVLEDCWSTNGTFLASGERLVAGGTRRLAAGARFYLADASQMFELRAGGGG